jgi:hypothetical protein
MRKKRAGPADFADQMAKADEIMREDAVVLKALAGRETECHMGVAREVMVRRRRGLRDLAKR